MSGGGLVPGQRVMLEAHGLSRRPATVDAVTPGAVLLVLASDESLPRAALGAEAMVEFPGRTGLYRATGTLENVGHGALRLLLNGSLERIQRRQWARAEAVRPAQLAREDGDVVDTWTLDLSAGGARLVGPKDLEIGERIRLRLRLDPDREIVVDAVAAVARETVDGHMGVRIEQITERDREALVRFVFEQERISRRLAAGE